VTAGAKPPVLESCEGDEYVIAITFLDEESTPEDAPVDIVLKRLNDDGTTDELQFEGDLSDARALASTLEGEGNCVKVEAAQPEEESPEDDPGAHEEAPGEPGPSEEVPAPVEEAVAPAESSVPSSP
jgi:hypothetical protein